MEDFLQKSRAAKYSPFCHFPLFHSERSEELLHAKSTML